MLLVCLGLLAYAVGSVPFGYVLVRLLRGVDVRGQGSRSIGAINVIRVGGAALGMATLVADVGKALGMVAFAAWLEGSDWAIAVAGLGVMLGHAFSIWLYLAEERFPEGKSVACSLGVLIGLGVAGRVTWLWAMAPLIVWGTALIGPRIVNRRWPCISPATMLATLCIPIAVARSRPEAPILLLAVAMALLVLARHKGNIQRLLAGTEPRLGQRHEEALAARMSGGNPAGG